MKMKKKSPVVEMTGQILNEIQTHNVLVDGHKEAFIKVLKAIEWNLVKSNTFNNAYSGQALGYARSALVLFGKELTP